MSVPVPRQRRMQHPGTPTPAAFALLTGEKQQVRSPTDCAGPRRIGHPRRQPRCISDAKHLHGKNQASPPDRSSPAPHPEQDAARLSKVIIEARLLENDFREAR